MNLRPPAMALWHAHHWPDDLDRCVLLGHRHVCRRCAVLYPVAFVVMAIGLAVPSMATASWMPWMMMLAPIPVTIEWIAEHLGGASYRPRRQMMLTALAAPALGIGLARYLRSPSDRWFWIMVAAYGGICGLSALAPVSLPRRHNRVRVARPITRAAARREPSTLDDRQR